MSWDQPDFSFDQGQPPTPTRTPTSSSFNDLFQTPHLDPNLFDSKSGWNYDGSNGTPNLLKTPRALLFSTPKVGSPAMFAASAADQNGSSSSSTLALNAQKLLSTPSFEAMPMGHGSGFAASPKMYSNKQQNAGVQPDLSLDTSTSFNSASSMQTPPPTTTSATKRKGKLDYSAQKSKSAPSRRTSVPLAPKPIQTTPLQRHGQMPQGPLDLSPDMFGFGYTSPATAPPVPSQRLPWSNDNNSAMDFLSQDSNIFDTPGQASFDPFGLGVHTGVISDLQTQSNLTNHPLPVHNEFMASLQQSIPPNNSERAFGNVDPSLLFSSPSKGPPVPAGGVPSTHSLNEESLLPYAYQIAEAKRTEKSYNGIAKPKKKRKPSVDSPAVQAALETLRDEKVRRPQIRRSMTDSVVSATSRDSRTSNPASSHDRPSPDKKARRQRRHRTSLALTIDANGKARTEARVIEDSSDSDSASESTGAMDIDRRSDSAVDSASDSDSDSSNNEPQLPRQPRLGRFSNSASHSASHSQKSSLASASGFQRPATNAATTSMQGRSFGGNSALHPLKEASFGKEDNTHGRQDRDRDRPNTDADASAELRKILSRRGPAAAAAASSSAKRLSGSFAGRTFSSPEGYHHSSGAMPSNLSPTTVTDPDLASAPSSARSGFEGVRCVCMSTHEDGHMVQCESCRSWLHMACLGLQADRLPEIYLCLSCTGSTPIARNGRVREPNRRQYMATPSSPLAHKGRGWR